MQQTQTYKYATIILAIVVIALVGYILMNKQVPPATDALEEVRSEFAQCESNLEDWNMKYGGSTSTAPNLQAVSEDAREELASILSECKDAAGTAAEE